MKCFIDCSLVTVSQSGAVSSNNASMDKNDTMDFLALARTEVRGETLCWRSCQGKSEMSTNVRVPGRGVRENDQREIQAADRLGSEGWSATLWRDQNRPAQRFGRRLGNCAPRTQPRIEGAHRDGTDRPQG